MLFLMSFLQLSGIVSRASDVRPPPRLPTSCKTPVMIATCVIAFSVSWHVMADSRCFSLNFMFRNV